MSPHSHTHTIKGNAQRTHSRGPYGFTDSGTMAHARGMHAAFFCSDRAIHSEQVASELSGVRGGGYEGGGGVASRDEDG